MEIPKKTRKGRSGPVVAGVALVLLAAMIGTAVVALAGSSRPSYSQSTPDEVVQSAVAMVKNGDAKYLGDLLYADSVEMRGTLNRLGVLLDHVQTLAAAIKKRFPDEVEKYRAQAQQEAASGKTPSLLGALTRNGRRAPGAGAPGAARAGSGDQEEIMRSIVARLFSDPYGWIEENESRLSTMKATDDTATVLVDNVPVAGVGIPMRLEKGKWYIALPTNMPPISQVIPRAPEQWQMVNSLIKVLDNTVVELTADVKEGRLRSLKSIGDKAQEKVIFPGALWLGAYSADLDARGRVERAVRQFKQRKSAWEASREKAAGADAARPAVSPAFSKVMDKVATKEIEGEVRARKFAKPADMSDADFESMVSGWLAKNGVDVKLSGALSGEPIDQAVAALEAREAHKVTPRKNK